MAKDKKGPFDYKNFIRQNRVFILGAGFSAAAGVPLTGSLLERTMRKFASEYSGLYERVDSYVKTNMSFFDGELDYSSVNFSNMCTFLEFQELREYAGGERWSDLGSREKLALRFYLSKCLMEHTPVGGDIPELYINFAKQLHYRDIVLTFNWDVLLELALQQSRKQYTYNWVDDKIQISKLHGSINWSLGIPTDLGGKPVNTLGWESIGYAQKSISPEIYCTPNLCNYDNWGRYEPLREVKPFLVLPGYGKAFDVRSNAFLWYKPESVFWTTCDIYIIGLSLAPDDFFIRGYFIDNLPFILNERKIYIINSDPESMKNYNFILSRTNTELFIEPFSTDHINIMKNRLNDVS